MIRIEQATSRPAVRGRPPTLAGTGALAALATLAIALAGCGSGSSSTAAVHPATASTSAKAGPYVLVPVRNDTAATVDFIQCVASCSGPLHERRTIPAGASTSVLNSNEGIRSGYLIQDASGRRLGCVYLKYAHVTAGPTVLISSMTRCE